MHTITRERLDRWLDGLAHEKTLIAPAADGSVTLYREVARADQIDWATRPLLSAKGTLFPQTERLLTIDRTGQQVTLHAAPLPGEQVIVGRAALRCARHWGARRAVRRRAGRYNLRPPPRADDNRRAGLPPDGRHVLLHQRRRRARRLAPAWT